MQPIQEDVRRGSNLKTHPDAKLQVFAPPPPGESPSERLERLYRHPGGPLLGWLGDEASRKGHSPAEMSRALGVNFGYVLQLCNGVRNVENVSQDFLDACARYLGVPTIVCKVLSGNIRMSDFLHRADSEHEAVDRCLRQMMDDPVRSKLLPYDPMSLEMVAKRALVLMHLTIEPDDFLGVKGLPKIVQWLQRCAVDCYEMNGKVKYRLS
jgi:transcriptional regulator with XRE-family HTH domain